MTRPVVLTAGKASRAGHYAPAGCKALVSLDGRPVIEHQLDVLGADPVIVCRSEHAKALSVYGDVVVNDDGRGAGHALDSAMRSGLIDEPVYVAYADTYFSEVPAGEDWVGVEVAEGGRAWYVVGPHRTLTYVDVAEDEVALVGVGLFHFSDPDRLAAITGKFGTEWRWRGQEWGLDVVCNTYKTWRPVRVPSWRDVGDEAAIERWQAA